MKKIVNIAAATGLALLMGAPVYAVQDGRYSNQQIDNRTSAQGRITMISREGNQYRIQLDNGGYNYWVPAGVIRDRNLRVGDTVSLSGYGRANGMNVDVINTMDGIATTNGSMIGTVERTNRHLNYITVRDQSTGRLFKVDVRNMNTRQSVNVWRLRPGDRIVVNGGWENRNTFQANTVNF